MATKADLLAQALEKGLEANEGMTKAELETLLAADGGESAEENAVAETNAIMALNVKHDGVRYNKGEHVMLDASLLALFSEKGFIETTAGAATAPADAAADAGEDEGSEDEGEEGGEE